MGSGNGNGSKRKSSRESLGWGDGEEGMKRSTISMAIAPRYGAQKGGGGSSLGDYFKPGPGGNENEG